MLPAARRSGEPGGAGAAGTRRAATGARLAAGTARLHSRDRSRARLAFGLRAGDPRAGRRRNVDIPAWMYFGEAPSGHRSGHADLSRRAVGRYAAPWRDRTEIGRASCRERVGP